MMDWTEGDITVDGTNIHWYRTGMRGKPPVVLLHGFTDSGLCWRRLATDLAADYDLVMTDAVGHGKSGGPERGFRTRAVSDVIAVIGALGLDRPAVIGHSMGGSTAAGVTAAAPDRVRAAILEDPGWRDAAAPPVTSAGGLALGSPAWAAWNRSYKEMTPEERTARSAEERAAWPEVDRPDWAEAKAQFNLAVLDHQDEPRPPWREVVAKITCPVLLITADPERGAIITPEQADEAARLWRTGRIVYIPGAGHNIRREQYEPFLAAVTAFLAETVQQGK